MALGGTLNKQDPRHARHSTSMWTKHSQGNYSMSLRIVGSSEPSLFSCGSSYLRWHSLHYNRPIRDPQRHSRSGPTTRDPKHRLHHRLHARSDDHLGLLGVKTYPIMHKGTSSKNYITRISYRFFLKASFVSFFCFLLSILPNIS
jgi:hypothetical protein